MFVEWVLEANGVSSTFHFQEKLQGLKRSPIFPPSVESRSWLKERLAGLYRTLEPLRGTIIHDKHFTATDGAIAVSSSKKGIIGPVVDISAVHLRTLALTIVSVLRYVDGTWHLDDVRDKTLRYDLDALVAVHGLPLLGQRRPFHTRVRVYSADSDPLHVDPTAIESDLTARYVDQDCSFDLRVLTVKDGAVVNAYSIRGPSLQLDVRIGAMPSILNNIGQRSRMTSSRSTSMVPANQRLQPSAAGARTSRRG